MSESAPLSPVIQDVVAWLFGDTVFDDTASGGSTPPDVERSARRLLLDTLGCMIGGGAKPELKDLAASLATVEPGAVALPGMAEPLTAPAAAYWCAMAATWDEACEGLARAHGRPGLHAFGPAMALTLSRGGTLGDALKALVRGYEVGGRLGERLRIRPGMHVDGTWGTFGAVAAACSTLGYRPEVVMAAIEAAACQTPMSLYLPVGQGATVRNAYVAEAARRAITLSLAVASGVTTPTGALEVFEQLALGGESANVAVAPPGEWLLPQGYLKPYAAVRHVHYGARAALEWHHHGIPSSNVNAITLDVYPEAVTYCGNRAPQTAIEAQFSLTYGLARMLVTGDLGPDAYTETSLADPEVRRLERLVAVEARPGPTPDQRYATLRIGTMSGVEETIHIDEVVGDAVNPMTTDDVATKFLAYTEWLTGEPTAQRHSWSAEAVVAAVLDGPLDLPLGEAIAGRVGP